MRFCVSCLLLLLASCSSNKEQDSASSNFTEAVPLRYATGFRILAIGDAKLVEVLRPFQGATSSLKYLLVKKGMEIPDHNADTKVIQVPIEKIVCTSTTHIPLLDYLDSSDRLIGFPTTDYISSVKVRQRIDSGFVADLGNEEAINLERLVMLKPDLVMGYSLTGRPGQLKKMEELGIPVIINAEYLEPHPLGRAEWIKFMAAFLDRGEQAEEVFNIIETNYIATKDLILSELNQPTVMSGVVYNDAWFLPGGQNYAAKLLRDAGYRYLWENDSSSGFLRLSFEAVYEKAKDADYWIGVASFSSRDELEKADNRYALFKSFKENKVYTYDARKGAKGGSEFLELGYLRPDIILKDLIKISHPDLLHDHQLYFHKRID